MHEYLIFLNGCHTGAYDPGPLLPPGAASFPSCFVADGGLNSILKNNIPLESGLFVGDFDSINSRAKAFLKSSAGAGLQVVPLPKDKNWSDFGYILDYLSAQHLDIPLLLRILGGLGGRLDHEWINLEEALLFLKHYTPGAVCLFEPQVILSSLPFEIRGFDRLETAQKIFSVVMHEGHTVGIEGALYSGRFTLHRPSHGLSNQVHEDCLRIDPGAGIVRAFFKDLKGLSIQYGDKKTI